MSSTLGKFLRNASGLRRIALIPEEREKQFDASALCNLDPARRRNPDDSDPPSLLW
jgi:hypothetical protein